MLLFAFILAFTAGCNKDSTQQVVPIQPVTPLMQSRIDAADLTIGNYTGNCNISMIGTTQIPSGLTITHPNNTDFVNVYISCWQVTAKAVIDTNIAYRFKIQNFAVAKVIQGNDTISNCTINGTGFIGNNQATFNLYVTGTISGFNTVSTLPISGTFVK